MDGINQRYFYLDIQRTIAETFQTGSWKWDRPTAWSAAAGRDTQHHEGGRRSRCRRYARRSGSERANARSVTNTATRQKAGRGVKTNEPKNRDAPFHAIFTAEVDWIATVSCDCIVLAGASRRSAEPPAALNRAVLNGGRLDRSRRDGTGAADGRWPDGRVNLGPLPQKKACGRAMPGSTLATNARGIDNPRMNLPTNLKVSDISLFQAWARALSTARPTTTKDNTAHRSGGPQLFHTPYGFEFVEEDASIWWKWAEPHLAHRIGQPAASPRPGPEPSAIPSAGRATRLI